MSRVLLIGSINMDLVVEADSFPRQGETLFGRRFATYPGGKGANQAVAAARLGANVSLIACVGRMPLVRNCWWLAGRRRGYPLGGAGQ
jgi:ribokinase